MHRVGARDWGHLFSTDLQSLTRHQASALCWGGIENLVRDLPAGKHGLRFAANLGLSPKAFSFREEYKYSKTLDINQTARWMGVSGCFLEELGGGVLTISLQCCSHIRANFPQTSPLHSQLCLFLQHTKLPMEFTYTILPEEV